MGRRRARSGTIERQRVGAVTVVLALAAATLTLLGAAVLVGGARLGAVHEFDCKASVRLMVPGQEETEH